MAWSEDVLVLKKLLPRLSAAADLEQTIELSPEESGALVRWIKNEKYRR